MNTNQVKCFLAVAETLNFTKAAAQLFMTQPGLSRHIVSLERELNTLLFIRDKQKVRLTPAGALLAQNLKELESRLEETIHKVRQIGQGYNGTLTIGIVGGQWLGEKLTEMCIVFSEKHPNINLVYKTGSFAELRDWLVSKEIDIAITLYFDVKDMEDIICEVFDDDYAVLAISKHHSLGRKKDITLDDIKNETFICISSDDSRAGYELTQNLLRKMKHNSEKIKISPNLATTMMWIETAQGVGFINHSSNIAHNSSIRLLENIKMEDNLGAECFSWHKSNLNPAISLFINI